MANLRANKITSTEVFETTGSVQFDGSGDYLEIPNSSDLEFGNNSFTIEAWLYPVASGGSIFNIFYNKGVGLQCYWKSNTNKIEVYADSNNTSNYDILNSLNTPSGSIISGQWAHIAIVRNINVFQIYLNGIASGSSITNSASIGSNSNGVTIGDYKPDLSNYEFNGHISNLRVLKGTALYTKNFTPPTRELTVIPNTVLLACTSTTNTAQEATGKTITVNGNAVANELTPGLLTDRVKSGGTSAITGSVEFDGTGDYLTLASSGDFAFGTGDFTVEMWVYHTDLTGQQTYFGDTWGSTAGIYTYKTSNNEISLYDTAQRSLSAVNVISANTWYHIAWTRQSGILRAFLNGSLVDSDTYTGNFTTTQYYVGDTAGTSSGGMIGFISNLRVLKGTALYTGSFIPPSRELKKIPNTVLLCCKNSSDPTAEETGKTITANGDPAASNFTPQIGSDGSVTFDGVTKINTQNYFYIPTGNTENRGRGRGVFGGGYVPGTSQNTIQFINIQSSGSAIDFGELSSNMGSAGGKAPCAAASSTRALFASGYSAPATINTIEFITIATTSNSTNFGDLLTSRRDLGACSSSTRALFGGGTTTSSTTTTNVIEYVTIASLGNAVSFGTLTQARRGVSSCSSSTRGIFGGGYITASPTTFSNRIDFVTIATTGNATTFGDLTVIRGGSASCSSSVRGIFAGGTIYVAPASTFYNTIDYITIASTGNAQDFGDLTSTRNVFGSCSNSTRGVFGGGGNPTMINTMEFVSITSTGNVQDFGDLLSAALYYNGGCSDSHGGIEG